MSILKSAYTFAAVSFAAAVVVETAEGTEGAMERVVMSTYDKVSTAVVHAVEVAMAYIPKNHEGTEALGLLSR
jgi:hypothetical protein